MTPKIKIETDIEPVKKVYLCKNCGTEISVEEYMQNSELCFMCIDELFGEFS